MFDRDSASLEFLRLFENESTILEVYMLHFFGVAPLLVDNPGSPIET